MQTNRCTRACRWRAVCSAKNPLRKHSQASGRPLAHPALGPCLPSPRKVGVLPGQQLQRVHSLALLIKHSPARGRRGSSGRLSRQAATRTAEQADCRGARAPGDQGTCNGGMRACPQPGRQAAGQALRQGALHAGNTPCCTASRGPKQQLPLAERGPPALTWCPSPRAA